ncbi:hypothetical protein C5167_035094 [Papaver somniferum]|uniref:Uncharacterized protein n=1 Tax=Papaver somniferum TaxID=3469 RepID=A0A4Y7KIE6_PAPSO|nr:hypothetical protein C5167_035094 [Papaver somniferum]
MRIKSQVQRQCMFGAQSQLQFSFETPLDLKWFLVSQADDWLKGLRQIKSPATPGEEAVHPGHTSILGSLKGAVDPCMMAFQKLPSWVDDNLLPAESNCDNSRLRLTGWIEVFTS